MNLECKEQRKKHLEKTLKDNFDIKFIGDIPNITDPLLLILNYSPQNENTKIVSFAFSLSGFYEGKDNIFNQKFWMTEQKVKNIKDNGPTFCESYKEFDCDGHHFYPFSAQLDNKYNFLELQSMTNLLYNLYQHIEFS